MSLKRIRVVQENLSPLEQQQYQRLRVNRIALIQDLKVDHILPLLEKTNVLDQLDICYITDAPSMHEKASRLLDVLPVKGRSSNWYRHFRTALLNPLVDDINVRQSYQIIVEFLDNTIIDQIHGAYHRRSRDAVLYKYPTLPVIGESATNSTLAKPSHNLYHDNVSQDARSKTISFTKLYDFEIPNDFMSKLIIPESEISQMELSLHEPDRNFASQERITIEAMIHIEAAYFYCKSDQKRNRYLCMCKPVYAMLLNGRHHHFFAKYLRQLKTKQKLDIMRDIASSFETLCDSMQLVDDESVRYIIVELGFGLAALSVECRCYEEATKTVRGVLTYLSHGRTFPSLVWIFNSYTRLSSITLQTAEYTAAESYLHEAMQLRDRIENIPFTKEILDCCELYLQLSIRAREYGDSGLSYNWAQKAMQSLPPDMPDSLVNVLCCACQAYSSQWNILVAEDLAVAAVQNARFSFGVYHPIYLQSLLCYVNFANDLRKDMFCIEAAAAAVTIATKLYPHNDLMVARSLESLARALIANGQYNNSKFFTIAEHAYHMAIDELPVCHYLLCSFRHTLCLSLLAKAGQTNDTRERDESLKWALGEARQILTQTKQQIGDTNERYAKALVLQADIYTAMKRYAEAEQSYSEAHVVIRRTLSPKHGSVCMIQAALGSVAALLGNNDQAAALLKDAVDSCDTGAYFIGWYSEAYQKLINCHQDNEELVKELRSKHLGYKWISEDSRRPISWRELHAPPENYDRFLERLDMWRASISHVKNKLHEQSSAKHS